MTLFFVLQKKLSDVIIISDHICMKIKFLEGPYKDREVEFTSPGITIGRDGGNQLILDTDGVSRCHAELKQLPDGSWQICDLNSTNGVKVNGRRIDGPVTVKDGDNLTVGENTMTVTQLNPEPSRVIFNPIISTAPAAPVFTKPVPVSSSLAPEQRADGSTIRDVSAPPEQDAGKILFQAASDAPRQDEDEKKAAPDDKNPNPAVNIDLKKFSGSLFGQKKGARKNEERDDQDAGENNSGKKRSNWIFYTVVTCVVIMVMCSAYSIMNPGKKKESSVVRKSPLVVRYEKEVIAKDNVFRFDFQLKSTMVKAQTRSEKNTKAKSGKGSAPALRREYSVIFTIDDIASHRHFTREVPLSDESVEELRQAINSSGIYAASAGSSGGESNFNRRLTVVEGNKILTLAVAGEYAGTEFNAVEDELIRLTEAFGLKTIAMTPEELVDAAKNAFIRAEEGYANRRGAATNLRDAIKNYQITVESLEQFSPKPPLWDQARRKLAEAVKERDITLDALETEYRKLAQQRSFEAMKTVFRQMMDLTDPESREHSSARRRLIYIEQALRKKTKR